MVSFSGLHVEHVSAMPQIEEALLHDNRSKIKYADHVRCVSGLFGLALDIDEESAREFSRNLERGRHW